MADVTSRKCQLKNNLSLVYVPKYIGLYFSIAFQRRRIKQK